MKYGYYLPVIITLLILFLILAYFNYQNYFEETRPVCHKPQLDIPPTFEEINATSINIVMTINERVLLWRYLKKAKSYFEYGAGGSTEIACQLPHLKHFITVDSNNEFMMDLTKNSTCLKNNKKWVPHHLDLGHTHTWGYPKELKLRQWLKYAEGALEYQHFDIDLILIDARFRLLCALISLLHFNSAPVLIHDFYWRYEHYKPVFEFADLEDCVDELVVLKRKPDMDKHLLQQRIDHIIFHVWPQVDPKLLKKYPGEMKKYLGQNHIL